MKKVILIAVVGLILSFVFNYAYAQEKITLSTYYPAPYGEYRKLAIGSSAGGYTAPTSANIDLVVEGGVGIGTTSPQTKLDVDGDINISDLRSYQIGTEPVLYNEGNVLLVGRRAGINNTTGYNLSLVGYEAGLNNTTGYRNTFVGTYAGKGNTDGMRNTFVGSETGQATATAQAYRNTFVGSEAGKNNTDGWRNTFIGAQASESNTTGDRNTIIGSESGRYNQTGSWNTYMGTYTGQNNTAGSSNTIIGGAAGRLKTGGSDNTFIGTYAGENNGTGARNVFIGYRAGRNETGSNKLYIANSDTTTPLIYGDFSTGNVGIGTTSPNSSKGSGGYLDTKDVYLRDTGTWASEAAGGGGFGAWTDVYAVARFGAVQGPTATDGFVVARGTGGSSAPTYVIKGYTGSSSSSPILRIENYGDSDFSYNAGIAMPVRKGDYWKVTGNFNSIYWISLGN